MPHLLIIDPADFIGGAELFAIDLIKNLDKKKYQITLLTSGNPDYLKLLPDDKCTIIKFALPRLKPFNLKTLWNLIKTVWQLKKIIKQINPDIIQTNSVRSHVIGALAVFKTKRKLIWYLHDYTFPRRLLKYLSKIPEKIITNSYGVAEASKKFLPKDLHNHFTVIQNGVWLEKLDNIKAHKKDLAGTLKASLSLPGSSKLVGIVGRIDTWKGQDCFIMAAAKVLATCPKTHFLIIGDGSDHDPKTIEFKKYLLQLVSDFNLKNQVHFLGFRTNIFELIFELDVLVHAATEPEPFGRVVIEGLALDIPVVASFLGGPSEIITDQKDGFLVDPKNTDQLSRIIIKLLTDEKLRQSIIKAGQITVRENYDLKKILKRIEKVYEKIG